MVTVGTFDGVHKGHHALLQQLKSEAAKVGMTPAVVTFRNHPLALIDPMRSPKRLTSEAEHASLLQDIVNKVIVLDFDPQLRSLTAEQFLTMLRNTYNVRGLLLGFNNHLGSDHLGYGEELKKIAKSLGIKLISGSELIAENYGRICSSTIRKLIADGMLGEATHLLGHPYTLTGTVEHGKALGRKIGFPTANLSIDNPHKLLPPPGVYAGYVDIDNMRHPVMVNIGHRPTVDMPDAPLSIEAHIIDFEGNIYNQQITLHLLERLRSEMRFPSIEALRQRLCADAQAARSICR